MYLNKRTNIVLSIVLLLGLATFCGCNDESEVIDKKIAKIYKAAKQGDAMAQNNLGVCYANGEGVAKDMAKAVEWFRKAAEQGDAGAKKRLRKLNF